MNRQFIADPYYGRVSAWERRATQSLERTEVNQKIEAEKHHFVQKMSLDDCQRFEALENLYTQASEFEEIDSFAYGLRMGALFMDVIWAQDKEMVQGDA